MLRSTEVIPVFFDLFHGLRRMAWPASGSRLTRRRPSHHPAREEFGSWCEGCCGCERASACEKLELVYQHLLGRLLLVKAAAKALCLIRRGLVIKGAPNHFFCRGPCLHEGKPHSGASAARGQHAVVVLVGLCFSNKPTCADAIRDSVVGQATSRASSGTQKPG